MESVWFNAKKVCNLQFWIHLISKSSMIFFQDVTFRIDYCVIWKINNLQKLAHFTPSGQHVEKRSFALDPTHVEANDGSIEGSILM